MRSVDASSALPPAVSALLTTDLYIKTSLVAATGPPLLSGIGAPPPPAISNLWQFGRRSSGALQRYTPVDIGYRRDSYPSMEWYQDTAGGARTHTICRQRETSHLHLAAPDNDLEGICYSPEGIT